MSPRKVCPQCGAVYGAESRFCSVDGATLVMEQPAHDLVGTIVADRYLILERIGVGGMGQVFLAEHVRMKRKSALKIMREALTSDPIAVSRFHREAENASQITHPNVAAVYDFGETSNGMVYIAMEYVPGEPLSDVLDEEGALNPARVADIIAQAADALSAAHALGILHRDLKPDNIMLTSTRWGTDLVKLVDFGISRAMASATQQFTSTGIIVGTPDYMSPEQLTGDALDSRSDQYALGLIAFYSLTGSFPFPSGASMDALLARVTNAPRTLAEAKPDVDWPPAVQTSLDRALALDVGGRYAEVHEFGRAFEAAVAEMPGTETMERYREALRYRFTTPTRAPAVTPSRPVPSIESTPIAPVVSAEHELNAPPAAVTTDDASHANVPLDAPAAPAKRPSRVGRLTAAGASLALLAYIAWRVVGAGTESSAADTQVPDPIVSAPAAAAMLTAAAGTVLPPVSLDSAATLARASTFALYVPGQQGTAFLVDPMGIVLTSADFARGSMEPRIQLEPERRVVARLMAVDTDRGVAAFRIPIQHCRRCTALRLASHPTSRVAAGDSLIVPAASGRGSAAAEARGRVTRADGRTLQTTLRLGIRGSGAPVLARDGAVVAAAIRRRGATTLVSADALTALRLAAIRRRMEVLPNDTTEPMWPATPVPPSALRAAVARTEDALGPYRALHDGFALLVMTPQVMAWRNDRIRLEIEGARVMSLSDSAAPRVVDPVQLWRDWNAYVSERRAAVVLHVTPELGAYGVYNRRAMTDFTRGDVAVVRLYRDNELVVPIETARIPAVVNAEAYRGRAERVYSGGIAVYHPREFARRSDGRYPELRLEIVEARPARTVKLPLPEAALTAIQRDLASYQR